MVCPEATTVQHLADGCEQYIALQRSYSQKGHSAASLLCYSLCLRFLFCAWQIMWDNGHHASPIFVIAFYGFCHLCSAVTMFKELDMREAGDTYFAVSGTHKNRSSKLELQCKHQPGPFTAQSPQQLSSRRLLLRTSLWASCDGSNA
jgi:hypothetical protein